LRARLDARSPVAPGAGGARAGGWRAWFAWRPLVPAGALAGLVAIALSLGLGSPHDERDALLLQEVIAGHVRASIGERLVDVASSDQHTVKPWLSARLDYSPPVSAAPEPGTTFVGGRIDYLDGRQVAALVYRRRQHVIDAYVWPGAVTDSSLHAQSLRGFNSVHWSHSGMNHWLVSDINRDELLALARAIAEADPPR
jgi:anti-sigma factor RsiW